MVRMSTAAPVRCGPYEIAGRLGAGVMGEVYRARDPRLGRDVALKMLRPGTLESAEHRRRFEAEARAASSLNHPHIVTMYDVGEQDGAPYCTACRGDHDVLGFQVAMRNPGLVRRRESLRDLHRQSKQLAHRHRAPVQQRTKRLPVYQLSNDVERAMRLSRGATSRRGPTSFGSGLPSTLSAISRSASLKAGSASVNENSAR